MTPTQFEKLIRFWRSIEALSPQDPPKIEPQNDIYDLNDQRLCPWVDPKHLNKRIDPAKMWRYSIYLGLFEKATYASKLKEKFGKTEGYEEDIKGNGCLLAITVDEFGRPAADSLVLSMPSWAIGAILEGGVEALDQKTESVPKRTLPKASNNPESKVSDSGFSRFDTILDELREELALRVGQIEEGVPVDFAWLTDFTGYAIRKCNILMLFEGRPTHRIKCSLITRPKIDANKIPEVKTDDEILNSFFIKDLNKVLNSGLSGCSQALVQYVKRTHTFEKWDVRSNLVKTLTELNPTAFPQGTWPSAHPLAFSQQMAVNAIWSRLGDSNGLFAVNGPPGTGKTTLLRDLISAVIVKRANILKDLKQPFGSRKSVDKGPKTIPYFPLHESLLGQLIVVASSNNGAVENISLELPREDSIDQKWLGKTDYWRDIGSTVIQDRAWGLLAGKLGNKGNRSAFMDKFFWLKTDDDSILGLQAHLNSISKGTKKPQLQWFVAVQQFEESQRKEEAFRAAVVTAATRPQALAKQQEKYTNLEVENNRLNAELQIFEAIEVSASGKYSQTISIRDSLDRDFNRINSSKPGILEWISTFGASHKRWRARLNAIDLEINTAKTDVSIALREVETIQQNVKRTKSKITTSSVDLRNANDAILKHQTAMTKENIWLGEHWPNPNASDEHRETSSPWSHPDWRNARIEVFLAALNLHRSFVETHADKMKANLGLANDVLDGSVNDPDARRYAFDSLGLVCPVISTTFASTSSLFGNLGKDSIGWLLIDEAGQATPQAAVGAIWRAKRVVVVGDPLQLEPVVNVPRAVEASSAKYFGNIDDWWHPSRTSVQKLADNATCLGTTMSTSEGDIWVGAPLRVHRRCDEPMFSISNNIAYEGLMVHGKSPSTSLLPKSSWLDVATTEQDADGNWIPAEGRILENFIRELMSRDASIQSGVYLVSPFRKVVDQLKIIGKRHGIDPLKIGTIHTTQGKEAVAVIVVLGGGTSGARNWAAQKPNLLNVAATRAKTRLYIIGDRSDWSKRRYFDVASRMLG